MKGIVRKKIGQQPLHSRLWWKWQNQTFTFFYKFDSYSAQFLTFPILEIFRLFIYPFVIKNSLCTVLQKWGHANHRTPATPSTTKHTHAFYNGMCMYRSYRMVQRNLNFLCIFRKLTRFDILPSNQFLCFLL